MFRYLVARGRVSRELFATLKESEAVTDQSSVYICHLRKALKRFGSPMRIATIYGWGYELQDRNGMPTHLPVRESNRAVTVSPSKP